MADLRNGEVAVDVESNQNVFGPAGTRKRKATSCYLLVGGSANTYKVTISTVGALFCVDHAGKPCKGNTWGKAKRYGDVHSRDRNNPIEWCKHVQAAMADTEAIAEAQDLTAAAFGGSTVEAVPVPRKAKVKTNPNDVTLALPTVTVTASARERLAAIEAEKAAIVASLNGKLADLLGEFGADAVYAAIDEVRESA